MLSHVDTIKVLTVFYQDCLGYWKREGNDERTAHKFAVQDVSRLKTNPFDPDGEALDEAVKAEFVKILA